LEQNAEAFEAKRRRVFKKRHGLLAEEQCKMILCIYIHSSKDHPF
jgi:hypothetical protein